MTLTEKIVGVLAILVFLLITGVAKANPVQTIGNWLSNEKTKIVEYQTENWAKGKTQLANTKQSILNLFKGNKDESQN